MQRLHNLAITTITHQGKSLFMLSGTPQDQGCLILSAKQFLHGRPLLLRYVFLILLLLLSSNVSFAQEEPVVSPGADDALEEELRYLRAETYVITASRIPENIKKTAASVTVITDKEIRQMGARNLADVIQTIPGMNFHYSHVGNYLTYGRGLWINQASRTLFMINSHSLNDNLTGGAGMYDTLMLDNVKRIEFIRGPGSALYGANAFNGVINVITKEAADVDGWEVSSGGGTYDTQQYNLLYGKILNDLELIFNYNYFNTHGFNGHVNKDTQTFYDRLYNTNASLAPGRVRGDDEKYDVSINMKYKGFTFDGRYLNRERESPVSNLSALSNKNINAIEDYYLNLSYNNTLWDKLDLFAKVYRNYYDLGRNFQIFPPGTAQPTPLLVPVIMPEGMLSFTSYKNTRTGFEIQTTNRISGSDIIVAGVTYEEMKQYDVRNRANYLQTSNLLINIPLPQVVTLTDIQNINKSVKRNLKAFFIENIWDITKDFRLTIGGRYDDYSDFGDSFNPRAGLVWEFTRGYDLKLLYGHAFRAPSFSELYDLAAGNPDLDPERVDTLEVSLGAELTPSFIGRLTWFRNWTSDSIGLAYKGFDVFYKNYSAQQTEGLEVETRYDFGRGTYLAANYTYQIYKERFLWAIPRHTGNMMANIRLSKYLNLYTSCHIEDGFRRDKGDYRNNMSGYAIVNTTLIARELVQRCKALEIRGSVYNLFDKDYTSPTSAIGLPDDMPRPGRNYIFEVKYKF